MLLESQVKMRLDNQIAGFFKMQYFKKEESNGGYFWYADKH